MVRGQNSFASDERFAHISTDPRFKTLKKSEQRIKADARWRNMLKDERFTHKATAVDKRGRPNNTSMKEDLRRLVAYLLCNVQIAFIMPAFHLISERGCKNLH